MLQIVNNNKTLHLYTLNNLINNQYAKNVY